MKYRHAYHAGNFADVFKHLLLLELLLALQRKPAALYYLETHAGRGSYPFASEPMQSGEHRQGIGRLLATADLPASIDDYVELIRRLGSDADGNLREYPGSPVLAMARLRPQDRAAFFELDPAEAAALRVALQGHPNSAVHHSDGYRALRSELPPRERRGLVLIDPPYETQKTEFDRALQALTEGHTRWPTGVYALWYPIKRRAAAAAFHGRLQQSGLRRILVAELCIYPDDSHVGLNGCGLAIVNPPWQMDSRLDALLPALHLALGGRPETRAGCFWLVPE